MKCMVVYSSKTGNTKMIAEAVHQALLPNCEIYPVQQAPLPDGYDFIAIGGWVDKGMPDKVVRDYMQKIKGKNVGIFLTLGACPDSQHALDSMKKAEKLLRANSILGHFICQGKIDPKLIQWMRDIADKKPGHPHAMNEKRKARLEQAANHPNEQDCKKAAEVFGYIFQGFQEAHNP